MYLCMYVRMCMRMHKIKTITEVECPAVGLRKNYCCGNFRLPFLCI